MTFALKKYIFFALSGGMTMVMAMSASREIIEKSWAEAKAPGFDETEKQGKGTLLDVNR